jgi:hypothetical protein
MMREAGVPSWKKMPLQISIFPISAAGDKAMSRAITINPTESFYNPLLSLSTFTLCGEVCAPVHLGKMDKMHPSSIEARL